MAFMKPTDLPASWHDLAGWNLGYVVELYERFIENPDRVDPATRDWFEKHGAPPNEPRTEAVSAGISEVLDATTVQRILAVQRLVQNFRDYGHLAANVNPIETGRPQQPLLELDTYGLQQSDLMSIPATWVWPDAPGQVTNALDAIAVLRRTYSGTIAFEFSHVNDEDERMWLTHQVETNSIFSERSDDARRETLIRLIEVAEFEEFLHRTFVGQKRFSIEGVDMLVPIIDEIIRRAAHTGARSVMMGMAHRGRLNVLAHILGKPYADIFSEFHMAPNKELVPSEGSMGINYGWTGDVKYHLGARRQLHDEDIREVKLILANNPSHLEFVNPVVEGYARASQEDRSKSGEPVQDIDASIAILVHGDAAFPGEGVVAETLNLSRLRGYQTGGTIHIIANNQLGFTAEAQEGRSTRYASDLAKGFEIPVVHVNADDPDACIAAAELAHVYRQRFHKDFLIDLVGYRKWGHNEMDDPVMTQPQMYEIIHKHKSVRALYAERLLQEQVVSAEYLKKSEEMVLDRLQTAFETVKSGKIQYQPPSLRSTDLEKTWSTGVPHTMLEAINRGLLTYPQGFEAYSKLSRILERRRSVFEGEGMVDWAHAEVLALASILVDGTPIRMTGQDSERGTFSQRHLVLRDTNRGTRYCPLQGLSQAKASFAVHNSPLSEAAVIGFEYGYNVVAPETLVLWEAQFGDFANAGQVLIDQFLSSGRAKWAQSSGLVLLLPHGYEGQGPEHSSARLERYLQLSAEENWRVVHLSTSAQYFHLLRLQAKQLRENPHPLVVMTPKSLLRNPRAASDIKLFTEGAFQPVIHTRANDSYAVKRIVFASGKVTVDLEAAMEGFGEQPWLATARLEQLYPFPEAEVRSVLEYYPNLRQVVWLQEEPMNMGAWRYVEPKFTALLPAKVQLKYIGRPERSSPAEGLADVHEASQRRLLQEVLETPGQSCEL